MVARTENAISVGVALRTRGNVMKAVMLRDMRTRFFNHGLGFLIVSLWPLAHMLILLTIYTFVGRRAPYGTSLNVFFATGLVPTLAFTYISRFMAVSLLANRPMMNFSVIRPTDIMVGRAALETVAAMITLLLMFGLLLAVGDDPFPFNLKEAVSAYATTLLLAVGVGSVISILGMINSFIMTAYMLIMILMYVTSGTLFVASALPGPIISILSWNPVLHCVEWMRTAYYPGYPTQVLDKSYAIGFGLCALFLGLALERLLRRALLG